MRTLAIVALSLALAACGGKPKPATTPDTATGVQTEAEEAAPDDGVTDDGEDNAKTRQAPPSSTGAGAAPSSPVTPSRGPSTSPHAPSGEIDTAV